jgi:hypothetical protein
VFCHPVEWFVYGYYRGDNVLLSGDSGDLDESGICCLVNDPNFTLVMPDVFSRRSS